MLKKRIPEQVRLDAIKMGIRKAQNGCPTCAEKYFDLAKQHGATEQEIQEALEQMTGTSQQGLSRRELMKIAVASGLALTTTGVLSLEAHKTAEAASSFFGIDSNTTICCSMPLSFYIGHMGFGVSPDKSYFAFNVSMAQKVGSKNTFGYWGLQGADLRGGDSSYNWGVAQADAAWNGWLSTFIGAQLVSGYTVFADVETGFGGWGSNIAGNQDVINGFLHELFVITPTDVWPGLYISQSFWNAFLGGNSFTPANGLGYVLWMNGTGCGVCDPCSNSCGTTTQDAERLFANNIQPMRLGGQNPVLWQYWLTNPGCNNSGCGDWNISSQLTQSLQPAVL